ncbi:MAG: glycoside hydrolase family 43 protein [Candidatus Solibacter sp.]
MRKLLCLPLLAASLCAQMPVKTGAQFSEFSVHDPFIVAHKETRTYYLYNSASPRLLGGDRGGVVAYKSKDLLHWDGPYKVFEIPDGLWADPQEGVWAPEVHLYRGKYYLLATLHNSKQPIAYPDEAKVPMYQGRKAYPHMRGTQIFVAATPDGPFKPLGNSPAPPSDFMTLDGTLYIEDGTPYMVYAHEWLQMLDGTMEAVPLKPDLTAAAGKPFLLFHASEAPWVKPKELKPGELATYVTDGPCFYRTKNGKLLMLWSSYRDGLYVETLAHSTSGKLRGPWKQDDVLVGNDSGHGMLFDSFDGKLMLVLHQPFRQAHGKLFEMEDTGDTLRVKQQIVQ